MEKIEYAPIGKIKSCYKEKFGTPRQPHLAPSSQGVIVLDSKVNPQQSLQDLENFSHLWVLFHFHLNTNKAPKAKIHPPRLDGQTTGLFATRSPHRFNPIGLSVVKLESIEGNKIFVSGVDLVEGTPVLDIKPYVPASDSIPSADDSWTTNKPDQLLHVEFSAEADLQIKHLSKTPDRLKALITETVQLDPRALCYKGNSSHSQPYGNSYGFLLETFNVIFEVNDQKALITSIENQ